ncbi:MAG: arginine--tRNA ligase [Alphaproteobacteria bacterium]|nr:arginine--tRNA ligase [Alphaproteobacteria bacterium]
MTTLTQTLSGLFGSAFAALGLGESLGAVKTSDRPELAQFQCNGAMAGAKALGKNPREIAQAVIEKLQSQKDVFQKLDIAGPGFINITLTDDFIARALHTMATDPLRGVTQHPKETIILDYGGPNIAKPMHVGHLRAAIIGDALRRMCLYAGYRAIGDVHMGDWGLPMGQIISELEIRHPDWPYFDPAFAGPYPAQSPLSMDDLEEIYPAASNACKNDQSRLEAARLATRDLQDGRPGYRALWQHFISVSIAGMKANFTALGVHFDWWKGEADAHPFIGPMVEKLRAQNLAVESDGALVVPVAREDDKKEIPPLILYKSDGAVMYGTTDLATIVDRVEHENPAKIIYVVDQRQALHFEQVFRAARLSGIAGPKTELIHAGFGTMNGTDGKPFKTRAGGVMKLEDLITMAVEKAQARLEEAKLAQEVDTAEKESIARKVGIAALKFADLQNNRVADYIFDIDRFVAFEGKTGPYLQYQAVRIQSLLRKAESQNLRISESQIMIQDSDRSLALFLCAFPDHFEIALRNHTPHVLCDYAFTLAQAFSTFYGACHILSEPDAVLRQSRLHLCALTLQTLTAVLGILGIDVPERM